MGGGDTYQDASEEAFVIFDAAELDILGTSPFFMDAIGLDFLDEEVRFLDFVDLPSQQQFMIDFLVQIEKALSKTEGQAEDLENAVQKHFRMEFKMKLCVSVRYTDFLFILKLEKGGDEPTAPSAVFQIRCFNMTCPPQEVPQRTRDEVQVEVLHSAATGHSCALVLLGS